MWLAHLVAERDAHPGGLLARRDHRLVQDLVAHARRRARAGERRQARAQDQGQGA